MATPSLDLIGAPGSPYTRKMRAALRYRRIPFHFVIRNSKDDPGHEVPVQLIPVLALPGEKPMVDSTFQIARLEEWTPERSLRPPDPVLAFVDALLEDYADEWLTKAMFHYRWTYQPDIDKAGEVLPRWSRTNLPEDRIAPFTKMIVERQVGRLGVVGSNATTAPVIEDSYVRLLKLLDAHLTEHAFLLGERPAASDFAMFGQLTQLVLFDPTPAAVTLETAPRVVAWVERVEDLSGLEVSDDDWLRRDAVPATLRALLSELGRVYTPFLLANAAALERGDAQVEGEIDGRKWVQKPFAYQGKCLRWLREGREALAPADRKAADGLLAGTGCEALFPSARREERA